MFGNLNSTLIGQDHQKPKARFPGSGGANDFGFFYWREIKSIRTGMSSDDHEKALSWILKTNSHLPSLNRKSESESKSSG
jgi:hypothetical protein